VDQELGDRIATILDGGPCTIGVESTIVALEANGFCILRPGGISQEQLKEILGPRLIQTFSASPVLRGPGMLESHYAPRKPLKLLPKRTETLQLADFSKDSFGNSLGNFLENSLGTSLTDSAPIGLLLLSGSAAQATHRLSPLLNRPIIARSLSETGDLKEMARNLFFELRWLDESPAELILAEAELLPFGLGHAILDRLKRASSPK
jgi:L-threonylcarbamoyladenylate synthase